jgi:hypothetical protein
MTEVQRHTDAVNQERIGERAIARTKSFPIDDSDFPKERRHEKSAYCDAGALFIRIDAKRAQFPVQG